MDKYGENGNAKQCKNSKCCPNCGEPLPDDAIYCKNCGLKLNSKKESFFKRNLIILIGIVLIIAIVAITSSISNPDSQIVDVGTINFKIPLEFKENTSFFLAENDSGIVVISKTFESSTDLIMITVIYSSDTYVDANLVNDQIGGHKQEMLGYTGFLRESHGTYSFSFVKKNMLITIYASDIELFDEITVL